MIPGSFGSAPGNDDDSEGEFVGAGMSQREQELMALQGMLGQAMGTAEESDNDSEDDFDDEVSSCRILSVITFVVARIWKKHLWNVLLG